MTAKVTFGNINGVDNAATHVTLQDAPKDHVTTMISMASSSSGADGLKQRRQGGSSSSQPQESSVDPTSMKTFTTLSCVQYTVIYTRFWWKKYWQVWAIICKYFHPNH